MKVTTVVLGLLLLGACAGSSEALRTNEMFSKKVEGLADRLLIEGSEKNERVDHYAVLIGAHTELRHRGNLSMAYQILIEQGYQREHIYILESEGDATFFPTTDIATRATVTRLFDHLKKVVEPQDTLLIYVTGHGRRVNAIAETNGQAEAIGVSTILLNNNEELADWEFSALLEGLDPAVGIAFFDQCYGAIFASTTKSCNFVFITTAAEEHTSYGVSFPRAFWGAFRRTQFESEFPTVMQAYTHAAQEDRGTQMGYNHPQITHSCVDPAKLTLLGVQHGDATVLSVNEMKGLTSSLRE